MQCAMDNTEDCVKSNADMEVIRNIITVVCKTSFKFEQLSILGI